MKEKLKKYAKRYFIDAMGAMALGLFASLLIGTIFKALGMIPIPKVSDFLTEVGGYGAKIAGPAMAVAIAYALKAHPLVIFSSVLVGYMANEKGGAGGPLAVLIIAIAASEIGMLVSKKTKIDILVTPFVTILTGGLLSVLIAPPIGIAAGWVGSFIGWATLQQPFLMGLIVSVVVGIALTLPISSAAICAAIGLSGMVMVGGVAALAPNNPEGLALAGGAAIAGCCAQMVGFAVMSFKENKWGGLISQGIGTSMLQMPNIVRNPRIWIPTIVASAITGPLSTCVFGLKMYGAAINSGMGTCGFLGPIGMILGWFGGVYPEQVTVLDWVGLFLICFILPAVISIGLSELLYKIKWIKPGDLKLED